VVVTLAFAAIAGGVFAWRTPNVRALMTGSSVYRNWTLIWPLTLAAALAACAVAARLFAKTAGRLLVFAALLVGVQVIDLAMLHYRMPGQRFEYADIIREEAILHPRMAALRDELHRTGERVLATDGSKNQFLLPNLTRPWNVPAASGTGSLGIERYVDVLGMGGPGDVYPETLSAAHRGLDLFSIRYALVRQGSPLADDLQRHAERWSAIEDLHYYENDPDTHYTLFRNARALPRAWCVPDIVRVTPAEALAAIRSGPLPGGRGEFNPARVALVEPDTLRDWQGSAPAADAPFSLRDGAASPEVLAQVDRQHRYLVGTNAPCLLVLGEVYYPWWRASVDDADVEIARVNHTMIGIPVPPGSHVVRLRLDPTSIWWGGGVTVISLLAWSAVIISSRVRRLRHEAA